MTVWRRENLGPENIGEGSGTPSAGPTESSLDLFSLPLPSFLPSLLMPTCSTACCVDVRWNYYHDGNLILRHPSVPVFVLSDTDRTASITRPHLPHTEGRHEKVSPVVPSVLDSPTPDGENLAGDGATYDHSHQPAANNALLRPDRTVGYIQKWIDWNDVGIEPWQSRFLSLSFCSVSSFYH